MRIEKSKEVVSRISNPRWEHGNIRHELADILVIGLCTIVRKGKDFTDMEDFGRDSEEWLRGFLELPKGIPDSDTFRRVFKRVNPAGLSEALCFMAGWARNAGNEAL